MSTGIGVCSYFLSTYILSRYGSNSLVEVFKFPPSSLVKSDFTKQYRSLKKRDLARPFLFHSFRNFSACLRAVRRVLLFSWRSLMPFFLTSRRLSLLLLELPSLLDQSLNLLLVRSVLFDDVRCHVGSTRTRTQKHEVCVYTKAASLRLCGMFRNLNGTITRRL